MPDFESSRSLGRHEDGSYSSARSDRRKKPTNPLSLSSFFGSRRVVRRKDDRQLHYYVDRYGVSSGVIFFAVVLFSTIDAFITLRLISLGGREINPVMDFFLQLGPTPFLLVKYILTGISILFLMIHKEFYLWRGRIRVKYVMALMLVAYLVLFAWEVLLLLKL